MLYFCGVELWLYLEGVEVNLGSLRPIGGEGKRLNRVFTEKESAGHWANEAIGTLYFYCASLFKFKLKRQDAFHR